MGQLPDPSAFSSVGWAVVIVVSLATGVNQVFKLLDRWREKPSTSELQGEVAAKFASREVVEKLEHDLKREIAAVDEKVTELRDSIIQNGEVRRQSIEGKVEKLREDVKRDTDEIHSKVNGVSDRLAEMKGAFNVMSVNIANLTAQIQRTDRIRT